jgi:hypothetical protein
MKLRSTGLARVALAPPYKKMQFLRKINEIYARRAKLAEELANIPAVYVSSGSKKGLLGRQIMKLSFIETSICLCHAISSGDGVRGSSAKGISVPETVSDKKESACAQFMRDFLSSLILNTESFEHLSIPSRKRSEIGFNPVLSMNRRSNIASLIGNIQKLADSKVFQVDKSEIGRIGFSDDLTWERYAYLLIGHALELEEKNIVPYLNRRIISEIMMRRLAFCLLYESILLKVFDGIYYPLGIDESDAFLGDSNIPRFFDGILRLRGEDNEVSFLLKNISLSLSDSEYISNLCLSVLDARDKLEAIFGKSMNVMAFVPGYRSSDVLSRELYWRTKQNINIHIFYLEDLFDMFRLWDNELIKRFIQEKLK